MKFLAFISIFLLIATIVATNGVAIDNAGPVVDIMENLAEHTIQAADEMHSNLEYKVELNANALQGNIQLITTKAMAQLADAFYMASQKLPNCAQSWTLQELQKRVDEQLTNCTLNLITFRTVFSGENVGVLQGIQSYITELAKIPAYCESLNNAFFAGSTACFVERLAELNRNIGQLINQANISLIRSRKSNENGIASSTECTEKVVQYFTNFLNDAFKNC